MSIYLILEKVFEYFEITTILKYITLVQYSSTIQH